MPGVGKQGQRSRRDPANDFGYHEPASEKHCMKHASLTIRIVSGQRDMIVIVAHDYCCDIAIAMSVRYDET